MGRVSWVLLLWALLQQVGRNPSVQSVVNVTTGGRKTPVLQRALGKSRRAGSREAEGSNLAAPPHRNCIPTPTLNLVDVSESAGSRELLAQVDPEAALLTTASCSAREEGTDSVLRSAGAGLGPGLRSQPCPACSSAPPPACPQDAGAAHQAQPGVLPPGPGPGAAAAGARQPQEPAAGLAAAPLTHQEARGAQGAPPGRGLAAGGWVLARKGLSPNSHTPTRCSRCPSRRAAVCGRWNQGCRRACQMAPAVREAPAAQGATRAGECRRPLFHRRTTPACWRATPSPGRS